MLCRNFGEALNLLGVVIVITVGLVGTATLTSIGWVQWNGFNPQLALGVWSSFLILGLFAVILSPMH